MRIDKFSADVVRSDAAREAAQSAEHVRSKPEEAVGVQRADQVEISDAGRALAEANEAGPGLPPERIQALKQKVVGGVYDRPEVIAEVAHRMQASGDLRQPASE